MFKFKTHSLKVLHNRARKSVTNCGPSWIFLCLFQHFTLLAPSKTLDRQASYYVLDIYVLGRNFKTTWAFWMHRQFDIITIIDVLDILCAHQTLFLPLQQFNIE